MGIAITALAAFVIERLIINRLRGAPVISLAIVTIGVDIGSTAVKGVAVVTEVAPTRVVIGPRGEVNVRSDVAPAEGPSPVTPSR